MPIPTQKSRLSPRPAGSNQTLEGFGDLRRLFSACFSDIRLWHGCDLSATVFKGPIKALFVQVLPRAVDAKVLSGEAANGPTQPDSLAVRAELPRRRETLANLAQAETVLHARAELNQTYRCWVLLRATQPTQ